MKAIAYGELSSRSMVSVIYSTWKYATCIKIWELVGLPSMREEMRGAIRRGNHYINISSYEHPRGSRLVRSVGCVCH